ncbi:MAG: twin-arginine translocation signal domain-containing protein [Kiritimatiellae bacterium]|nr:twin-arginine translocation signal domain-containing protein [Kiritimatiellia bacterium]
MNRRNFIKASALAAAGTAFNGRAQTKPAFSWGALLHFGTNMWSDVTPQHWGNCKTKEELETVAQADHLRFDESLWRELTGKMKDIGMNRLVIDVGEGIELPSHPELAVKGSWKPDRMRAELKRLRGMGLEPIPKLNFSTAHDIWLKDYSRMISTPTYYKVCADVIRDVCEIFDKPPLFHLGYDEETAGHQSQYEFLVVRQGDLWWHDFLFFVDTVEKLGMRPWIWSDYYWHHPDLFLKKMPKSVMQSNWYYGAKFEDAEGSAKTHVQGFIDLDRAGFDQIPCGSNWSCDENFPKLVAFCKKNLAPERLKGFLMAPWFFTNPNSRTRLLRAMDIVSESMKL